MWPAEVQYCTVYGYCFVIVQQTDKEKTTDRAGMLSHDRLSTAYEFTVMFGVTSLFKNRMKSKCIKILLKQVITTIWGTYTYSYVQYFTLYKYALIHFIQIAVAHQPDVPMMLNVFMLYMRLY